MIVKTGNKYTLFSRNGSKKLGSGSEEEMEHREKQVIFFRNLKKYIKDHHTTKGFIKK